MFLDFLTGAAGERGLAGSVEVFIEAPSPSARSLAEALPSSRPLAEALPTPKQRIRTELAPGKAVSVRILCLGAR